MEKIGMVDEAFLLARIAKNKGGDGPSREEFNELVERVNGAFLVAEYGVTPAADIMAYIEAEGDFAPILVKRGNDLYTSLLASKKNDNAVYLRAIGSASGKYYIFDYTVTGSAWASKSYGLQELLESGVNIKTINGESVLGNGNIDVGGEVFIALPYETTSQEIIEAINDDKMVLIRQDGGGDVWGYFVPVDLYTPSENHVYITIYNFDGNIRATTVFSVIDDVWEVIGIHEFALSSEVATKQDKLVSGDNIKTINGESVLGPGNIDIQGGGGDNVFIAEYGVTEYADIEEAIASDKIIILHDPEMIPEGGSSYLVVTRAEALEGTAILNVYGAKSFGRYQIGMGRWVKSWEPLGGITEKVGYEVEIGSYVDGNGVERALFRKIIDLGALPNSGEKSVAHGIEFGFTITRLDGVMRQANGSGLPLPLVTLDTTKMVYISCGRNNVIVQTGSDRSGFTGTVTIEYYYS